MDSDLKKKIQTSYSTFLNNKNLKPRHGQKLMIATIARTLAGIQFGAEEQRTSDGHICVVEAGTGTGKTVAYLLAAIPIAQAKNKKIIVSTATVALQEQIVFKDLPELLRHSGLKFNFALAKGRGRYLCLSKLDRLLSEEADFQPAFMEAESNVIPAADRLLYEQMMEQLGEGQWDGDKDDWPQEMEAAAWQRVTTDHRQCTGRKCSFVRQCAFFKARDSVQDLDIVVANHDLVLADLALGGGAILPAPKDAIYILDEGHHLPAKALDHFSCHARVVSTSRWLGQTEGQWQKFLEPLTDASLFFEMAQAAEPLLKSARSLLDALQPQLAEFIPLMDDSELTRRYRFENGQVPADLELAARKVEVAFVQLQTLFDKLAKELNMLLEEDHSVVPRVDIENAYGAMGAWCTRVEANVDLWHSFSFTEPKQDWPVARWITLVEFNEAVDFELVSSPILASSTLAKNLWYPCFGAVVTSATMTALGKFDRYSMQAGLPKETVYEVVPSPFDFANNARFVVPDNAVDGNKAEEHTQSIIEALPRLCKKQDAVLVLFSSRRQMQDVYDGLNHNWQAHILMQGVQSKQAIIEQHKKRIDDSEGSMIFGLASFAEGVDLPGGYCTHVIIAKIPFAVPNDPLEQAMAEWIEASGGNPFMQMTVPDAAVKMVQACGRLLRSENDVGTITVLDRRLVSKRYGRAIMDALPPYERILPS